MELYKILNERINEEIREFYRINEFFLAMHTGSLFSLLFFGKNLSTWWSLLLRFIGFSIDYLVNLQYKTNKNGVIGG